MFLRLPSTPGDWTTAQITGLADAPDAAEPTPTEGRTSEAPDLIAHLQAARADGGTRPRCNAPVRPGGAPASKALSLADPGRASWQVGSLGRRSGPAWQHDPGKAHSA